MLHFARFFSCLSECLARPVMLLGLVAACMMQTACSDDDEVNSSAPSTGGTAVVEYYVKPLVSSIDVTYAGKTYTLKVYSNTSFTVVCEDDWVTVGEPEETTTSGYYNIKVSVAENINKEDRSSIIYFLDSKEETVLGQVPVTQGNLELGTPEITFTETKSQYNLLGLNAVTEVTFTLEEYSDVYGSITATSESLVAEVSGPDRSGLYTLSVYTEEAEEGEVTLTVSNGECGGTAEAVLPFKVVSLD